MNEVLGMMENYYRPSEIQDQIERIKQRLNVLRYKPDSSAKNEETRNLQERWCQLNREYATLDNCGNF